MEIIRRRPDIAVIVAFVVGLIIGLVVLGWWLFPVEWTDAGPQHLAEADQELYLRTVAELYAFEGDAEMVRRALGGWEGAEAACNLAAESPDPAERARLEAVAAVMNGQGCAGVLGEEGAVEEGGGVSQLVPIIVLLLFFVVLVVAIMFVINRRNAMMAGDRTVGTSYGDLPDTVPVAAGSEDLATTPLARFQTTYTYGHDSYDDSFSIENINGDFLGECGVGISESIGGDTPKNVAAFEVWLFDKNDIRTVTKVIMSDHAFFDEALKAKLAPKGEPVLARENETIVLETASLIINAEIKEMQYGTGVLPPQSYFERLTVELSAWAKEGDFGEADVQGRVDEILNY